MLRTDLIDVLNSGRAWAFVGSGASVDAGYPSWRGLIDRVIDRLGSTAREPLEADSLFQKALETASPNLARAFSRIEAVTDRRTLEVAVRAELAQHRSPGPLTRMIADLPFAGYVTGNYEGLLENTLFQLGQRGWISVGNTDAEIRKVAGDATRLVWHIHGGIMLDASKSRLILTEEDYDSFYLNDSPLTRQVQALLSQRRLVFIGFGFQDPEFLRLLKRLGRLTNPARPLYAFLPDLYGNEAARRDLLERYNVDAIPYRTSGDSHAQLRELVETYGAFTVRRSLQYDKRASTPPSYDPEATGLLIYNKLLMGQTGLVGDEMLRALLRARVLSVVRYASSISGRALLEDLAARAEDLQAEGRRDEDDIQAVEVTVRILEREGFLSLSPGPFADAAISLTSKGEGAVADQAATATRLSEQFSASLLTRASELAAENGGDARDVATAAEAFLKECVARRALGVAMALAAPRMEHQSYQAVALLQALPTFMEDLAGPEEAIHLTRVILGVLGEPSDAEATYLGLALQAQFGVHLLGYDPDALAARLDNLARTVFLVDSSTLIPYLARASIGHAPARLLISRLLKLGCVVFTTELLVEEVAEHARWALDHVDLATGEGQLIAIEVATGRAGQRFNAFLEGFLTELASGVRGSTDLRTYLAEALRQNGTGPSISNDDVRATLQADGVRCKDFSEWRGFSDKLFHERDELQQEIASKRQARDTYRHERQVKAEAEALLIVRSIRDGTFELEDRTTGDAFFVSPTRIIDEVEHAARPVTMRLESALHLVATIQPCAVEELGMFTNALLWELSARSLSVVDERKLLVAFSPLVDASREQLDEELEHHRALLADKYGEDAIGAFEDIPKLATPIVLGSLHAQRAEELERHLEDAKRRLAFLEEQKRLSVDERHELEELRQAQKFRAAKGRSARRAQQSGRAKRRRRTP